MRVMLILLVPLIVGGCSKSMVEPCSAGAHCSDAATASPDLALPDLSSMPPDLGPVDALVVSDMAMPAWTNSNVPLLRNIAAIWGSGPDSVFAGGQGGIIHTEDRGMTWKAQSLPGGPPVGVSGIWGLDASHVLAVGWTSTPTIWRTSDGGMTWDIAWKDAGKSGDLTAIAGRSRAIFVVGAPSLVLRSTDAGGTWDMLDPPNPGTRYDWRSVLAEDSGPLWISGGTATPVVFRSDDDGRTWIDRSFNAQNYAAFLWAAGNELFAGTSGGMTAGKIFHSPDAGKTWALQYSNMTAQQVLWISGFWGSSPSDVYALADVKGMLHTTDGGKTWTIDVVPPPNCEFISIWGSGPYDVYAGSGKVGAPVMYHKH